MLIKIIIETEMSDSLSDNAKKFIKGTLDEIYENEMGKTFPIKEILDKHDEYTLEGKGYLTTDDIRSLQKGLERDIHHIQI